MSAYSGPPAIGPGVLRLERKNNTPNGNPRYGVSLEGAVTSATVPTEPDAAIVYTLPNFEGVEVVLYLNSAGRVAGIGCPQCAASGGLVTPFNGHRAGCTACGWES